MKIDKCQKIVCNLCKKKNYLKQIKALTQALDSELKLKKSTLGDRVHLGSLAETIRRCGHETETKSQKGKKRKHRDIKFLTTDSRMTRHTTK